ncbi:MAG: DNA polymerase III subunit gamma/tau, partial [bacterium]|nr:DNA polymerase III subunit gamma/tau [bacterium]
LDQAIACCGDKLNAEEVRRLLGMFSLESLHVVTEALEKDDSRRMLEVVAELEGEGRNLQHFCRELSRYFRNLLVVKVAGIGGRLIAASEPEQKRMEQIAGAFSEEDLTRYLQITLDLFREMQFSLQPRLHLEIGLLKLVHAGRLMPIEEALAAAGQGGAPPSGGQRKPPPSRPPAPRSAPRPAPEPAPQLSGWQAKLHAALVEQGQTFIADAVEHSEIEEAGGELRFTAGPEFAVTLKSKELQQVVQKVAGQPLKVVFVPGGSSAPEPKAAPAPKDTEDEATKRALANPEVQRYRETFPSSEVRTVRNLKQ